MNLSARFNTRAKHHVILFIGSGLLLYGFLNLIPGEDRKYLWSMATGYTSIILLGIALLTGPLNVYTKRLNPVSSDLRRDVGIWCGLIGVLHVLLGIQVHMGNVWLYFFKAVQGIDAYQLRDDLFGFANYTGLIAGVLLIILLLLSNDLSIQWFKAKRWKNIQRLNYILFSMVVLHGVLYQIIEKRTMIIIILFATIMLLPAVGQTIGFLEIKRRNKL